MKEAGARVSDSESTRQRIANSLPDNRSALLGSFLWAIMAASSVSLSLWLSGHQTPQSYLAPGLIFAISAACSFVPALTLARFISAGRGREPAFAAAFVCLATLTIAATGFGYAAHHRVFQAEWHSDQPTVEWIGELLFGGLTSLVQFAVFGLRHYLPIGLPALFAVSYWYSRRSR